MILQLMIACWFGFGLASTAPLNSKGPFAPSPPGVRPPCAAKSATFCEEVEKYPAKLIQKLLQAAPLHMYDLFTDESEGLDEPPEYILHQEMRSVTDEPEISRKIRSTEQRSKSNVPSSDLVTNCSVISKQASPKLAANIHGEWKVIAQEEKIKFTQKIPVKICDQSEMCQTSCTQFYSLTALLAVDTSGAIVEDTFWMPSSCYCTSSPANMP
ncbi:hypothetical protein X975_24351, partial [Stegodyphus mimosarum]